MGSPEHDKTKEEDPSEGTGAVGKGYYEDWGRKEVPFSPAATSPRRSVTMGSPNNDENKEEDPLEGTGAVGKGYYEDWGWKEGPFSLDSDNSDNDSYSDFDVIECDSLVWFRQM